MSLGEITVIWGMKRSISFRTWNLSVLEHSSVALVVVSDWHVAVRD